MPGQQSIIAETALCLNHPRQPRSRSSQKATAGAATLSGDTSTASTPRAAAERKIAPTLEGVAIRCGGGYTELDKRRAELLFQVLTEREEKASVKIASNESFSGWTKTFTDPRLCAAIADRLTFNGTVIETGTDSYRLAHTIALQAVS